MITGNEPAMPLMKNYHSDNIVEQLTDGGLTIREHFAAMAKIGDTQLFFNHDIKLASLETGVDFLGSNLIFWVNVEARLKVMKADALIKALNNEQ